MKRKSYEKFSVQVEFKVKVVYVEYMQHESCIFNVWRHLVKDRGADLIGTSELSFDGEFR